MSELIKSEVSNTLNTEEEYNILFSDLFGTLLSEEKSETMDDIKKEILYLSPILNEYLSGNNFLSIISSVNHNTPECLAEIFKMLSDSVLEEYRDKIIYFESNISFNPKVKKEYGCGGSINIYGLDITFIDFKEEAVDITLNKLKGYKIKSIGGIGDTANEFELLNYIHELGGYTGIIGGSVTTHEIMSSLLNEKNNVHNIIEQIARLEFRIRSHGLIGDIHNNGYLNNMDIIDQFKYIGSLPEFKYINEEKDNRINELSELFKRGDISLVELNRIFYLDSLAFDKLFASAVSIPNEQLNLDKAEEILSKVSVLGSNFSDTAISGQKHLLKANIDIKMILGKTDN